MTKAQEEFGNESGSFIIKIAFSEEYALQVEGPLIDGKLEGIFRSYAIAPGKRLLTLVLPYFHDQKHGHCVDYFPDGTVMYEGDWLYGKKSGMWTLNTTKIKPLLIASFKDNDFHGEVKVYDKKGALIAQGEYRAGKPLNGSFISDPWKLFKAAPNMMFTLDTMLFHFKDGVQIDASPITLETGIYR
jgi:antitoxin component YwqK of YwqJK toxin-antitoxin module